MLEKQAFNRKKKGNVSIRFVVVRKKIIAKEKINVCQEKINVCQEKIILWIKIVDAVFSSGVNRT